MTRNYVLVPEGSRISNWRGGLVTGGAPPKLSRNKSRSPLRLISTDLRIGYTSVATGESSAGPDP